MRVVRLRDRDTERVTRLLGEDPLVNLFLLGYLDALRIDQAYWYGVEDGEELVAACLLVPGRLLVPWASDPDAAGILGAELRRRHRPCMVVGPRAACDALWHAWAPDAAVACWYDQRLYRCSRPLPDPPVPGFRLARMEELDQIVANADLMEREDVGRSPLREDPSGFRGLVRRRIESGSTWLIADAGQIVFQINVGTRMDTAAQVGGTWVPPHLRGNGLARRGMIALGQHLLDPALAGAAALQHVTLHVNEANTPAVRVYERAGYDAIEPFRLITLKTPR